MSDATNQALRGFASIAGAVLATEAGLPVLSAVLAGASLAEFGEVAESLVSDAEHDGWVRGERSVMRE